MYSIDERLKGLPALRDQVVTLYESLNQPHLAVPGRQAGPAKGYIVGLRSPGGFAIFVYLYLPGSGECAVYVPSNRAVSPEQYESEEAEALGFTESMGFMMDNLNFRGRSGEEQDQMMREFPVFRREPPARAAPAAAAPGRAQAPTQPAAAAAQPAAPAPAPASALSLGKLFGAFCLLALCGGVGCVHVPTEGEVNEAQVRYDLGVQLQVEQPQAALKEFDLALTNNPDMPEANNAKALLLHMVFGRPEEAITYYKHAIEVRPTFSEAKVNLGNVYLDQKRYDEAIVLYQEALNDMMYPTPFVAHGNLGWALYKKGEVDKGLGHIKSAVTINPKFCLGYRNLGTIHEDRGELGEACKQYGKFREMCPDVPDAYLREGTCLAKKGDNPGALKSFAVCVEKAGPNEVVKEDCRRLADTLGGGAKGSP